MKAYIIRSTFFSLHTCTIYLIEATTITIIITDSANNKLKFF